VSVPSSVPVYTVEDLAHLDGDYELDRGVLVPTTPGGMEHALICAEFSCLLTNYVKAHHLGRVYANDPGFILGRDPDTLRGPDLAFISTERLAEMHGEGFASGAPDLAVEVVGRESSVNRAIRKAAQYLEAGCRLVWVADIARRRVLEFHADGLVRMVEGDDALEGGSVLPGFVLGVGDFASWTS